MSESKTSRVGLMVLAFVVVAFVIVLAWLSRRDDSARGAEEEGAPVQKDKDTKGGDQAKQPPAVESKTRPAVESKTPPAAEKSLHDRLGGRAAIHALMGKLLDAVQHNEVIMANENIKALRDTVNARQLHEHITNFVCKATGGPCEYTGRTMKDSHAHLKITAAEWDAMAEDFGAILTEMNVPEEEAQELQALFGTLMDDIVTAR